ncbi:N-acetylglucosamine kinase [Rhodobacter sp. NTK016B]|uniref:N-acetylglucosamine kinase n=1 Tax=Rhodobacter sp. NTK016B TaxID=2759676 RepID=UPI001A8D4274|nr:BadF/BadG/BcrA/BcrD ATPase family protein [Rhodobacter sp. NTK016B]MBN8293662.1 N-acetylglucosamine kinase [Rhodobacter sp. NTK016B]
MRWLGVDMGGTATRWVLVDADHRVVARGETPGATGLAFDAAGRAALAAALTPIRAQGPVTGAYLGVTGAGFTEDPDLRDQIAVALSLPPEKTRVVNDMVLAWRACWPDGGGHLVAAGTGSVGFTMRGETLLIGGRGTLIDDAGSGAWIALRALDALWRRIDETGKPDGAEILAEALFTALGGADWEATRRSVYSADRGAIGRLARPVAEAAMAGDPLSLDLMRQAGAELARLARVLVSRAGAAPVAVIGGVLTLHPGIRAALEAATPGIALCYPQPDAALTAAQLAQESFA